MCEEDWKNNLLKKICPKSFSSDLQISILINPPKFYGQVFEKNRLLSKNNGKVYVLKTISALKCSYGNVECSFNKPAKKIDKRPKTSAQCLKMIINFICFPKQFFFEKCFYSYGECSFDRPAKFFLLNDRNCS